MSRQTRLSSRISSSDRVLKRKRKVSYKEPDSDDEYDEETDEDIPQRRGASKTDQPSRRYPKRGTPKVSASKRASAPKLRQKPKRGSSTPSISDMSLTSSFSSINASESCKDIDTDVTTLSIGDVLPKPKLPWDTLEHDILSDIFLYGARMLMEDNKPSNSWLINTATTCKAFQIPALAALYLTPPLDTVEAVRGFLAASAGNPEIFSRKVRHVEIEAIPALTRKDRTQEPVSLEAILDAVPNVRSLAVELLGDAPSSKRGVANLPSKGRSNIFKPEMIDTMDRNKTRLKSMKWNYLLNPDQQWPWNAIPEIHSRSCMQTVQNLEIVWLNVFTKKVNKKNQVDFLIKGIKVLPNIKSLTLSMCSLSSANGSILTELPTNLENITIIDCDDLTSESFTGFLLSHGSNLRNLILSHNRSLDLGFMGILGSSCPFIEGFKVDLSCYGLMMSTTDSEPSFQCLLPNDVIPTWPISLQRIEMSYLRKWEREAATIFFQSLVDSAQNLKNLRHITIKTTVDLDWRDRVAFRDEWSERLEQIFKRRSAPPRVNRSAAAKSSSRIIGVVTKPGGSSAKANNTSMMTKESIAGRLRIRSQDSTNHNSTTDSLPPNSKTFVQGLCDVVDIRIENLRPMETQYAERDFMDEEISGDEEWTGEGDYDTNAGVNYAW